MKTLGVLVMILAVGFAGCGEDGSLMTKDKAMEYVNAAMSKAGDLKTMLASITSLDKAKAIKDKLGALVPSFLSAKGMVDKIPAPVQKMLGGKFGEVTKLFGGVKDQAASLMKKPDIAGELGGLLKKITG